MFKICVVGCGNMSTSGHGPAYKKYYEEYKDVCLCSCCDLDEEKAKKYKESFGFDNYYTDYEKMLDEIKPDVVCLMSPVKLTKELSISIINKGYNIILEKPPGLNREEILEMIKAAEKNNVYVRTAFNRRYTPLVMELKKQLIGKRIFNITYQMYRSGRKESFFETTASHAIDVTKNIIGSDYKRVTIDYQECPDLGEKVANYYLNCEFENGVFAQISLVTNGGVIVERATVNTHNETYFLELPFWKNIDDPGRLRGIRSGEGVFLDIDGMSLVDSDAMFETSGFYEENRSFFEQIRKNEGPTCDLESGIQTVDLINCIANRIKEYNKN